MWRILRIAAGICPALALLSGAALTPVNAYADKVISDFDPGGTYFGGSEGWFNYGGMLTFGIVSNELQVGVQQYWGQFTAQNWAIPDIAVADFNGNSRLEFDVHLDGSGPNAWLPNGDVTVSIEVQSTGGGMGTVNKYLNPTFSAAAAKSGIVHVVADYSSLMPVMDPTATGWNLSFNASPGYDWGWDSNNSGASYPSGGAYIYYDNIKLSQVPEPASLGLLSMGGLAVLRRRRA